MTPLPVVHTDARTTDAVPPCVDRRTFLVQGSLAGVLAMLATACGNGIIGGSTTGPGSVNTTVPVADYPALANVGGIARINGVNTPVAVIRASATTFRAFSMVCPHVGTIIGISGAGFLCPNHLAQFDASGKNTGGQQTSNLVEFTVTANAAGTTLTIVG